MKAGINKLVSTLLDLLHEAQKFELQYDFIIEPQTRENMLHQETGEFSERFSVTFVRIVSKLYVDKDLSSCGDDVEV